MKSTLALSHCNPLLFFSRFELAENYIEIINLTYTYQLTSFYIFYSIAKQFLDFCIGRNHYLEIIDQFL